jgi:hypothetical protein
MIGPTVFVRGAYLSLVNGDGLMANTSVVRGILAVALASVASGACSDGSKTSAPIPAGQALTRVESAQLVISVALEAGVTLPPAPPPAPEGGVAPGSPYAIAVPMPPSTGCTIYPEGASNDPTRNATVYADASGEARF